MPEALLRDHYFRNDDLVILLHEFGEIVVNWEHIFPTPKIAKNNLPNLVKKLSARYEKIEVIGNVVQVVGPISLREDLDESLLGGHFKDQVNWRFGYPATMLGFDNETIEFFKEFQSLRTQYLEYQRRFEDFLPSSGSVTGLLNRIEDAFLEYDGSNFDVLINKFKGSKHWGPTLESLLNSRREIATRIESIGSRYQIAKIELAKLKNRYEISARISPSLVKSSRTMRIEEMLDFGIGLLDIEYPQYPHNEISWIGFVYLSKNEEIFRIYTTRDFDQQNLDVEFKIGNDTYVRNFEIIIENTEKEIAKRFEADIAELDPAAISVFNAQIDIGKLTDATQIALGANNKKAKLRSVVYDRKRQAIAAFMDSWTVPGRITIDLMTLYRHALAFKEHKDLKTVSEWVLGWKMLKDYQGLRLLDVQAFEGENSGGQNLALYLGGDVGILDFLIKGNHLVKGLLYLSEVTGINPEVLAAGPAAMNRMINRGYFMHTGTYRRKRYRREMDEDAVLLTNFTKRVQSHFSVNGSNGTHLVQIPLEQWIKNPLIAKYPNISNVYNALNRADIETRTFLSIYLVGLASDMLTDFQRIIQLRDSMNKFSSKANMDAGAFESGFWHLYDSLDPDKQVDLRQKKLTFEQVSGMLLIGGVLFESHLFDYYQEYAHTLTQFNSFRKGFRKFHRYDPLKLLEDIYDGITEFKEGIQESGYSISGVNSRFLEIAPISMTDQKPGLLSDMGYSVIETLQIALA